MRERERENGNNSDDNVTFPSCSTYHTFIEFTTIKIIWTYSESFSKNIKIAFFGVDWAYGHT